MAWIIGESKRLLNRVRELNQEVEALEEKLTDLRAAIQILNRPPNGTPPQRTTYSQVENLALKLVETKKALEETIKARDFSADLLEGEISRAGLTELEEKILISYYVLCKPSVWIMCEHKISSTHYYRTRAQAEKNFLEKWRYGLHGTVKCDNIQTDEK